MPINENKNTINRIIVSKDHTGDYQSIQAAIDAVPENNITQVEIFINNGIYQEVVVIPETKPHITLKGESKTGTVIAFDNFAGKDDGSGGKLGTSGSATVYFYADDTRVENLTFANTFDPKSTNLSSEIINGRQAVAVYSAGNRLYFKNVRFLGHQDTLYVHSGVQYFYQCYIEGDVDFIFGAASCVFENCHIHSLDRGKQDVNGYITAASTLISEPYGLFIIDSKFTSDAPRGTVYLGRPWPAGGNPKARGSVLIKNCELGEHIKEDGWTSMNGLSPEEARLYEYQNYGPGAVINSSRKQLSDEEVKKWTVENVLKGWNPRIK